MFLLFSRGFPWFSHGFPAISGGFPYGECRRRLRGGRGLRWALQAPGDARGTLHRGVAAPGRRQLAGNGRPGAQREFCGFGELDWFD